MIKITTNTEYMSIVLGEVAKLWIEQTDKPTQNGCEMRVQFTAFGGTPLDVVPTYAPLEDGGPPPAWPPVPVAAFIFLSPSELDASARSKRLLVTRRGSKDLLGFVTGPITDTDGLAIVHLAQIEEKAKITMPAGVELVVTTDSSSSVNGLLD